MKMKWIKTKTFPNIEGRFWLYGRVWGDKKPQLYILESLKISNGFLYSAKGSYLWENEIEGVFYIMELFDPELPDNETT